jgi:nucleoside-diphosphate-sugar epimerase
MSTILITGGAGFIGSHLAAEIARSGIATVRVLDNLYRGNPERLRAIGDVDFKAADVLDEAALRTMIEGCDVVFHLAAQSNVIGAAQDSDYSIRANVLGTYAVLAAARAAGVRRVVFTSSREVYGDPQSIPVREDAPLLPKNLYGASKCAGEAYCLAMRVFGIETVILRLANVYGPGDRDRVIPIFVENALTSAPLVLYGGQQIVDFIWIGDVVEALMRAGFGDYIQAPVNIGSGTGVTIHELAAQITSVIGSSSAVRVVPPREIEVGKFVAEVGAARRLLALPERLDPLFRLGDTVEWLRRDLRDRSLQAGAAAR